ncbi:MAG TPA: bacterial Ig-like domain-containing protein [Firmicutes bacterium]|nr:bacterial Ig-like domain-containing protein [Bacillota bacterium]
MKSARKLMMVLLVAALAMSSLAFVACGEVGLSSITAECAVTEYYAGDAFDMSGVTVTAHYSDGSSRTVAGWTVEGGENLTAGTTSVRLSYTEDGTTVSTDVAITVSERPHEHDYSGEWKSDGTNHWRECSCGEKTDVAAHVWSPQTDVTTDVSCTTDGKEIVTCSVCGYSKEQTITALGHDFDIPKYDENGHWYACSRCGVENTPVPHALTLTVTGMKTEYFEGDVMTVDGASASVSCDCGYTKSVASDELIVPDEPLTLEDDGAVIKIGYGELTFDVTVTVKELVLSSISVAQGYKQDYAIDEAFAGGTLVLTYENGSSGNADLTAEMLTGFDTSAPGQKTVTVTYEGKTTEFVIYVGRDADTGYYRLGSETGTPYKVQVEDGSYVDMSEAQLQDKATSKFENMAMKKGDDSKYPNGAEGYSTANISVSGNKITLRFVSDYAGMFTLGLRGQSGSGSGLNDQPLNKAFAVSVNGVAAEITGTLAAGSATDTAWRDMTVWTELDNVLGGTMKKGLNEIEFAYLGASGTLRFPNLDYFTVTFTEIYENASLEVSGSAEVPLGGAYAGGLTVTVKNGEDIVEADVPVTADMIGGLDSSTAGEKDITVNYLGLSASYKVTVVDEKHTLTIVGGTAGGSNTVSLGYGEAIPEITWDNEDNIICWMFGGNAYTDISGLTMTAGDATLSAIYRDECTNVKLPVSVRWNSGVADENGKAGNNLGGTDVKSADDTLFAENDGLRFNNFGAVKAGAQGITHCGNIIFGSGKVLVVVAVHNYGENVFAGVSYGTECGIVDVGDVASGETVYAAAVIDADGANHWTHLFWDGEVSSLDYSIAVYYTPVS